MCFQLVACSRCPHATLPWFLTVIPSLHTHAASTRRRQVHARGHPKWSALLLGRRLQRAAWPRRHEHGTPPHALVPIKKSVHGHYQQFLTLELDLALKVILPRLVSTLKNKKIVAAAAGEEHSLACSSTGA